MTITNSTKFIAEKLENISFFIRRKWEVGVCQLHLTASWASWQSSDAIPFRSSLHNACYERSYGIFNFIPHDAVDNIWRRGIAIYTGCTFLGCRLTSAGFDRTRRPCDSPNPTSLSSEPIYIRYALYTSYIYTRCIHHTFSSLHHTFKLPISSFS